jgi:glutamyl-tRNA synthetase/glutamyl-Q tRNA(Asp) synthetase
MAGPGDAAEAPKAPETAFRHPEQSEGSSEVSTEAPAPAAEPVAVADSADARHPEQSEGSREFYEANPPHSLRFVVSDKVIHWYDLRLGDFHENPKLQCGDFPIRDREGQWTYQFAVCVDDIDENITHIVRGEDIRSSTARQIALMEALGRTERPIYLHHPLIVDENNKKLSKRELAHSLRQDKEAGITPEMLFGRVCHKAHLTESNAPISLQEATALVAHTLPSL